MTPSHGTLTPAESAHRALREYQQLIGVARQRFAASRGIQAMISPETDARTMAAFLLHFSALSIPLTEPVEGWIRRAGERCVALGWVDLGDALKRHSISEAGHDRYHKDDVVNLIQFWNSRWMPTIGLDAVSLHGLTSGGERYRQLHEDTLASSTPYCQLAIEYEIELLPIHYGPRFVDNCVALLGKDILHCMSFATSHIEFDIGHSKFNAHFLNRMLTEWPVRLAPAAQAGAAALDAFGDHLTECFTLAESLASRR